MEPVVVGAVLALCRAERGVLAERIEVTTVVARVVKDTVEHDTHTASVSFVAQHLEIVLRAEHGVNLLIVARIVAVVAVRLKDGTEI